MNSVVEVVKFDDRFKSAYVRLNREWIEKHFRIEALDIAQLEDFRATILDRGGEIFFILATGQPIGTCAMVPHGVGSYELAKMAVAPDARGQGHGDRLMKTAIAWAEEKGASRVIILSNTVLEPAIKLYKKHGFRVTHLGRHPDYERCNIELELALPLA